MRNHDRVPFLMRCQTSFTATCCIIFSLDTHLVPSKSRFWRVSLYTCFGLSSAGFMIHGLVIHGWETQKARMSLVWIGWMAVANLLGATVYMARVIYFRTTQSGAAVADMTRSPRS